MGWRHIIIRPLSWYAALHTSKGRREASAFLVEGTRAIVQIQSVNPGCIQELVYSDTMEPLPDIGCPSRTVTPAQFKTMCLSKTPGGPLAVVTVPVDYSVATLPKQPGRRILFLEDIQDPGNVGTLIRCAAAFDFDGVLCSDKCADVFAPKAVQASCGAFVSVWIRRTAQYRALVTELKNMNYLLRAADTHGKHSIRPEQPSPGSMVLMLGNEGNGLLPATLALADTTVCIPYNSKKVESLNVAVSGAVCMYLSTAMHSNPVPPVVF